MPFTAATADAMSRWLNYLIALPMVIFGTIGGILTIIIFTRQSYFLRNPTIQYLLAGAVMTALHLPSVYLQGILVDGFGLGIYNTNIIVCREHHYLFYSTTVATISFPCWAAFDQYISTSRDATVRRRWSSIRMTRFAIVGTIIFWSIVYFPIIFMVSNASGLCAFIESPLSRMNDYFVTPVAYTIAPLAVIVVCTRGIIRNLQSDRGHNHNNNLKIQVRRMLIPQLIILSISGIPFGLYSIYTQATSKTYKSVDRLAIEHLFQTIIRLFYHLNFVCTFYTYLYRSKEMRKNFKRLMYGLIRRNQIEPTDMSQNNTFILNTLR
ncbi:unnamed protein product [Rotaria socialis]|uniref:G-protein coupled receptors family 1 profile domain-containing protein n=1 Tax=Rotaria socialis TaxID=392032 RepID=A0A817Z3Y3_9BILA|nr:unnamed protein product [Rotaria socialis]CAF3447663.1 unnamed protein product [Rotaria socialis]CAF3476529.1 unnamed protein product [Rotaria socialis]CAF3634545.1 unnamed protein product [Rotaria socialis]CAF3698749.1 unnamed protein product [Rotaria socialis]